MATNLAIDDALIAKAKEIGRHRTKKAAVTEALEEYIKKHEQMKIIELFGSIDYDESFDYKKQRAKK